MPLRVLFQSRQTLFSVSGGDTMQVLETKKALEARGVRVDVSLELEPALEGYDLVHLFNIIRPQEVYLQARNAKRQGRPVALSPIHVLYDEYERRARPGVYGLAARRLSAGQIEWAKIMARAVLGGERHRGVRAVLLRGYAGLQRAVAGMTDVVLPNSRSEAERVVRHFGLQGKPVVVVPYGFDTQRFVPEHTEPLPEVSGCVLSVGRIEGRKCQLELVRAMRGLPLTLVFAGQPAPHHLKYYEAVRSEAGPNVVFAGQIDHTLLPRYYRSAKVHALVSWFETAGLSSLEAAAMGCNLVITAKGDQRDYFGDLAFYCEPDSEASIRSAILRAYEAPVDPRLREHVCSNFTWDRAAARTLEGYERALAQAR